jgi:hypothetical protein
LFAALAFTAGVTAATLPFASDDLANRTTRSRIESVADGNSVGRTGDRSRAYSTLSDAKGRFVHGIARIPNSMALQPHLSAGVRGQARSAPRIDVHRRLDTVVRAAVSGNRSKGVSDASPHLPINAIDLEREVES